MTLKLLLSRGLAIFSGRVAMITALVSFIAIFAVRRWAMFQPDPNVMFPDLPTDSRHALMFWADGLL